MLTSVKQELQRATPESQGISSSAILKFVEAAEEQINELHSLMLVRHGKVVAEGWWSPYNRESPHMLFSLSKSFTSSAVGMAIAEGHFSLDDKVLSFFPDETPAEVNEHLAAMEVRHLLSMSTGHDEDTTRYLHERADGDWISAFFSVPVIHEPGTHFLYNTGATYILSAIVQKTSGQKLIDYLQPRLFEPLGIENPTWQESPQGINTGGFGLNTRTEDIARFGQMYRQKGRWGDTQILSEAWVEEATAFHISNGDDPNSDWAQGYGYQFWRCRHNVYRGDGAFGQFCIVMDDYDAVVAITSGGDDMQATMNLVWDILLPAFGEKALPEDAETHKKLTEKLASLEFLPLSGEKTSPLAADIADQVYTIDKNPLTVETVRLHFDDSGCVVQIKSGTGQHTLNCGWSTWEYGGVAAFNEFWDPTPKNVVCSAAWTDQDTLTVRARLYETPFYYTLTFQPKGDQITIETSVNVGFMPEKTTILTGKQA